MLGGGKVYQKREAGSGSCFNELSPGLEGKHMQRLEEAGAWKEIYWHRELKASRMRRPRALMSKLCPKSTNK